MGTPTGDGAPKALTGKPHLRQLSTGRLVTDAGLPLLHDLPLFRAPFHGEPKYDLMSFSAEPNNVNLTGRGFRALVAMPTLRGLAVSCAGVDDDALAMLPRSEANLTQMWNGGIADLMKPRVTVLTIGVDDLERSLVFYRDGLGLPTKGIVGQQFEYGAVVFFDLQHGVQLALWPRKSIARDAGLSVQPSSATEFTLGHNVNSKEEVDQVMAQAQRAGARIVKPAGDTFWGGYAGYFQDPDGHLWEIAWNPQMMPAE